MPPRANERISDRRAVPPHRSVSMGTGAACATVEDRRPAGARLAQLAAVLNPPTDANRTGLPDTLKRGVERLSGQSLDHVRVHRNSAKPAQLNAHAYAQGSEIHLAPGQESHLPHEAWHVVQQAQGRVKPTFQTKGVAINHHPGLEREADTMGARAAASRAGGAAQRQRRSPGSRVARVLQLKGDIGAADRATARGLAISGGVADPAVVQVIVPLLALHPAVDIQNALGVGGAINDTRPLFTSVARGAAIVRAHAAGLPAATILADGAAAADNTLVGLLALSLMIANAGGNPLAVPGAVRLGLLAAGRAPLAIQQAAVAIPALLDTTPRALALMDHLAAGGTVADAQRAAAYEPADATILGQALTALRALAAVPAMAALDQGRVDALLGERNHLTTPTLRTNAVAMATTAASAPAAVAALLAHRPFGYRTDFKTRADQRGAAAAATLVGARHVAVAAGAQQGRQQAIAGRNDEAFATLTRKERDALGGTAAQALVQPPPFIASPHYTSGSAHLATRRTALAQNDIQQIDAAEQLALQNVTNVEGPAEEARVRETHRAYFAGTAFHPDALAALDATEENPVRATAVVAVLVAAPATRPLFLGGISAAEIVRLLTVPPLTLGALIAAGVTVAAITNYAATAAGLLLLAALHAAATPFGRVNSLAPLLAGLAVYVNDGTSRGHLVTLLAVDTPADLGLMLGAAPGAQLTRPTLLVAVRPRAANAAILTQVLALCVQFGWSQATTTTCLTAQPLGSNLLALVGAVHAEHLTLHNKFAQFSSWMAAVGQLVTAGYVTINALGGWQRLGGAMVTDERNYEVALAVGGAQQDTFCVHFHPGAVQASIYAVNASPSHFKPQRGGDVRMGYDQAPQSIRQHTERRP